MEHTNGAATATIDESESTPRRERGTTVRGTEATLARICRALDELPERERTTVLNYIANKYEDTGVE